MQTAQAPSALRSSTVRNAHHAFKLRCPQTRHIHSSLHTHQHKPVSRPSGLRSRPCEQPNRRQNARERPTVACIATEQAVRAPDLLLNHPSTGARISVFGVEHLERQPYIGDWILDNKPSAVVVETACTPTHGAMPGNHITCADQAPDTFFLRVFCGIAAQLQQQQEQQALQAPGGAWQQAKENLNGEQLAYVAAFATGAALVFGDRPKDITYRRLFTAPTLSELDEAFSEQAASNYRDMLQDCGACSTSGSGSGGSSGSSGSNTVNVVDRIMLLEREAVMCKVINDLCSGQLPQSPTQHPSVAVVVGSAHLPGLQRLWQGNSWQEMVANEQLQGSCLMGPTQLPVEAMQEEGAGVRRGLLEALLQLSVTQEVLDDLQRVLPPVPDSQEEPRQWTYEIYSTTRMALAALPKHLLPEVVGAVKGCDMWEVLEPLRAVRPVNGGPGWSEQLGMQLRGLNFDLSTEE